MDQANATDATKDKPAASASPTASDPATRALAAKRQAAETRRLYAADWHEFAAWGRTRQLGVLPAAPETVAAYLHALSPALSAGALARRAAAIADRHRHQNLASPGQDASVRHVLRAARDAKRAVLATSPAGHAPPPRRPAPPKPAQLIRMAARCPGDLAGLRDRALLLLTAAGLGGELLLALDREHVHFTAHGVVLAIPDVGMPSGAEAVSPAASGADPAAPPRPASGHAAPAWSGPHASAFFVTDRLAVQAACPVHALERWLEHSETHFGPVFRKVNRWHGIEHARLRPDALRRIWRRRAAAWNAIPALPPTSGSTEDAT